MVTRFLSRYRYIWDIFVIPDKNLFNHLPLCYSVFQTVFSDVTHKLSNYDVCSCNQHTIMLMKKVQVVY
jgi:hypothetical protein